MQENCPFVDVPKFDDDLFREEVSAAEEEIAAATLHEFSSLKGTVASQRPTIQAYALHAHGNPSESSAPIRYHQALLTAEATVRRAIARGIGYVAIRPLLNRALTIIDSHTDPVSTNDQPFELDIMRGRVHEGRRGRMVRTADKVLRLASEDIFSDLSDDKLRQDIEPTFIDTSMRVRHESSAVLDLKFGDAWRNLDPSQVRVMKVKEIEGEKISRHDQLLLIWAHKLTNVRQSLGNAIVAAAEFTSISLEHMQTALAKDGVPAEEWYPYAFANLHKLGFAAKLPFWTAQNIGINASSPDHELLFDTVRLANGTREIVFSDPAHQKYYDKGLIAGCSGAVPLHIGFLRQSTLQTMTTFAHKLDSLARVDGVPLHSDWTTSVPVKTFTGADAATAVALSIAYSHQYDFTDSGSL